MNKDTLKNVTQDAQEYLQCMYILGGFERKSAKEYQQINYSAFTNTQDNVLKYVNGLSYGASNLMVDICKTPNMNIKMTRNSGYDMAKYILAFCRNHKY